VIRPNLDPTERLDPADEISRSRDGLAFRLCDAYRLLLGKGWIV
jgi:hypothetical protein